ncbi:hypothetical protein SUGI_0001020 [Cryptomeria japonica]|nr:hypothetical protein SUGI_0001020 [Cryptomeria japonica]
MAYGRGGDRSPLPDCPLFFKVKQISLANLLIFLPGVNFAEKICGSPVGYYLFINCQGLFINNQDELSSLIIKVIS